MPQLPTMDSDDPVGKHALHLEVLERIRADLETLHRTQADAREAATHEENRAEHAKDTRATEQSYLARGLAERVEALVRAENLLANLELRRFDAESVVELSALIEIEDAQTGARETWWLIPAGGGIDVRSGPHAVRTITPAAPLGRALLGLQIGDEGRFETPRGERSFEVLDIS
jgi:transcription elongation GreA/GreB family factor